MTDGYTNLKLREIRADFGLEGYGFYWICLELVGQQGIKFRLNSSKGWKKVLKLETGISEEKIEKLLKRFSELSLICPKSLERDELYIPKMKQYADEWTRRNSRVTQESLGQIEENRIDKNRIDNVLSHFVTKKNFPKEPQDLSFYYKRYTNCIKRLLLVTKGDTTKVCQAIDWFGGLCDKKGLNWTLETIEKWLPEYLSKGQKAGIEAYIRE